MAKTDWIEKQIKKVAPNYSLQDFLADILLISTGVAFVVLSDMGHKHGRVYILAGIFACFILRRLYIWLSKKPRITRVTKTKLFKRNLNFVLAIGGLLLTGAGLYSALAGIQTTLEGNSSVNSNALANLNTWTTAYLDLIYGLFGLLIAGLILLVIQLIKGKGETESVEVEKQPTKPSLVGGDDEPADTLKVNTADIAQITANMLQMKHEQLRAFALMMKTIDKLRKQGKKAQEDDKKAPSGEEKV